MTKTLEPVDYWKLRAICGDARLCEERARQARADLAAAHEKQTVVLREIGLATDAPTFTLDDATLTITMPETPSP